MAWVTYDIIEDSKKRGRDLRRNPVLAYLDSIGFTIKHTDGSHIHATAPDDQGRWTSASHGDNVQLSLLEIDGLHQVLSDYFKREAVREEAALNDQQKTDRKQFLPEWFTQEFLSEKGMRLRADIIEREYGYRTVVLIDQEYPELSVRVTFHPEVKPLSKSDIDGARQKLEGLKSAYLQQLDYILQPSDIDADQNVEFHLVRTSDGDQANYELRDSQNQFIRSFPIHTMDATDPAQRDAALLSLVGSIETTVDQVKSRLVDAKIQQIEAQEIAAAKQKKREEKRQQVELEKAKLRAADLETYKTFYSDSGFTITEGERDGKTGLVFQQTEELVNITERLREAQDIVAKIDYKYCATMIKKIVQDHGSLEQAIKNIQLVPREGERIGEFFVPLVYDEHGYPSAETIDLLHQRKLLIKHKGVVLNDEYQEKPITQKDVSSKLRKENLIYFRPNKDGGFDIDMEGHKFPMPIGINDTQLDCFLSGKVLESSIANLQMAAVYSRMEQANIRMIADISKGKGTFDIKGQQGSVTFDIRGRKLDINNPDANLIEYLVTGTQALLENRMQDAADRLGMTFEKEEQGPLRLVDPTGKIPTLELPRFTLQENDVAPTLKTLNQFVAAHELQLMQPKWDALKDRLNEFGYRPVSKSGRITWQPPMDTGLPKSLGDAPANDAKALANHVKSANDIVAKCEEVSALQQQYVSDLMRSKDAGQHVEALSVEDHAITVKIRDQDTPTIIPKAKLYKEETYSPLVTADGLKRLKQLAEQYGSPTGPADGQQHKGVIGGTAKSSPEAGK